ncbi:MAG TPA: hypothetical protein ENJ35_08225 [Gammaproteobacteria bacterium]|nr:hypothetical protein [Gammaproteobacteria bacterium]
MGFTEAIRRLRHVGHYVRRVTNLLSGVLRNTLLRPDWHRPSVVFLDIVGPINLRTLRELLIAFDLADYQVRLRAHWNLKTLRVGDLFRWHGNLQLVWSDPPAGTSTIVCTDQAPDRTFSAYKHIRLVFDYSPDLEIRDGHFVMPIPMHPQIYVQYHDHERLDGYRRSLRKIRIFFAGNWNETGYNSPLLGELFGKLTRHQIINFLLREGLVRIVETIEELDKILAGPYWNGFVLLNPRVRINQAKWLATIAQADFFLCPPGVLFPWSHNAIEAMAVGTIPLINYPEWFFPTLVDGKNVKTFQTLEELKGTVRVILQMQNEEISYLHQEASAYYEQHLNPRTFVHQVVTSPEKHVTVHYLARPA